jgi:hypothetical protein
MFLSGNDLGLNLDVLFSHQLVDLCVLDLESLDFPNRILAAAALHHTVSTDITKVTGIYCIL